MSCVFKLVLQTNRSTVRADKLRNNKTLETGTNLEDILKVVENVPET